jgi:dihydroorotate dehydrogenase electron transfer subunit
MPEDRALRVRSNEPVGASYHLLALDLDGSPPPWEPGQFAMLSLGERLDPLLRRPFSIYNLHDPARPPDAIQFLYKVFGRGSAIIAAARPGDRLSCLFPLGRGFAPSADTGQLVLVAGGAGVASLHPLAAAERRAGRSPLLLFGTRGAEELVAADATRALGVEALFATDDGSAGRRGYVADLLDEVLRERGASGRVICACGPMPMMRTTAEVAARHGLPCHVSLESTMACGFGVCVGCVVGRRDAPGGEVRYLRTCIEGPVMDARGLDW